MSDEFVVELKSDKARRRWIKRSQYGFDELAKKVSESTDSEVPEMSQNILLKEQTQTTRKKET